MTGEKTRDDSCPLCSGVLFRQSLRQRGDSIWLNTPDRAPVERDENGDFMKCPSCGHRVVMLPDPILADNAFYVSPVQDKV